MKSLLLVLFGALLFGQAESTVLVLVNDAYPAETGTNGVGASVYVGQHYAEARGIPPENVLHLNIPLGAMLTQGPAPNTYDFISHADYETYIQAPLLDYLGGQGSKILYIVPTYGVPYLLSDFLPNDPAKTWRISIDSMIAAINSKNVTVELQNPYHTSVNASSPVHFAQFTNPWKMYIVSRLDGPSAIIAAGLVDKARAAESNSSFETSGTGYYDWGGSTNWPDTSFKNANDLGITAGIPSVLNNQLTTGDLFAPASSYQYGPGLVYVFAKGSSVVTSGFNFSPASAGSFDAALNVLDNYKYQKIGTANYRLSSADGQSYWQLAYVFSSSYGAPPSSFTKVVNGKTVASTTFKIASPDAPVDTKDITLTFADSGGQVLKNGAPVATLTDPIGAHFMVSSALMTLHDMSVNLTGITVRDAGGNALWSDNFSTNTLAKYQWTTMPKQAQNASFIWGWYSGVHDAYSVVPGAIAAQLTSYTAQSIRSGGIPEQDNSWCPYFLRIGATATWGATGEPYEAGYALGDNLFSHFWRGYNFGESAYISSPFLNWMMIFIGDPLYKVNPSPPTISAVVNSGDFVGQIVSGSFATITGSNLSMTTRQWAASDFTGNALPTMLDNVSVKIDGKPAYVYYISPGVLNVIVPDDTAIGPLPVQVTAPSGTSTEFTANMVALSPSFFMFTARYPSAVHIDSTYAGPPYLIPGKYTLPFRSGETAVLFATGFGPTSPPVPTGMVVSVAEPLAQPVTATVGGAPAAAVCYLIAPGLYQLNITLPSLPNGDAAVVISVDGLKTPDGVYLAIANN